MSAPARIAGLIGAALLALAGCATPRPGAVGADDPARERIVEVATGREITRGELLALLAASDYVLLGERHDNALHHQRRGALLRALPPRAAVVAEHLDAGARVANVANAASGADLLAALERAGFDPQAWGWPLHQPLFAGALAVPLPLAGGNLPRAQVRGIAQGQPDALPPALAALIDAAPLPAAAQAVLDDDLRRGHCGQLPEARLPGMRQAQRARDASMWQALRDSAGRPAVLLAGNGHVRTDYGVPQLIARHQPPARVVSVGLEEPGAPIAGAPYTHVWITPGPARTDPCAAFAMPAVAPR